MQLLRLFVSSTFRDMQAERNILARLVLPRQRSMLAARDVSLQEVDLRWGVTRAMSGDGGAVAICLRELAGCSPLIVGMVGRRAGWIPSHEVVLAFDANFAEQLVPATSMTEIELRYAVHLTGPAAKTLIPVMIRSDSLSRSIEFDEIEWMASEALRKWALTSPAVKAIEYESFDEFERLVDAELTQALQAQLREARPRGVTVAALPEVARLRELTALSQAATAGRPTLICGERGVGATWLVQRWVREDPAGVYIDGRLFAPAELEKALRADSSYSPAPPVQSAGAHHEEYRDRLTSSLLSLLSGESAPKRIALDHYEDAATSEARSDITWIPTKLRRGCSVLVVTRNKRLREQAANLDWRLHTIKAINPDEAATFAEQYLRAFSKHLVRQQIGTLLSAPWATNLASLILALDELRRHGAFETLDQRLVELVACSTGTDLADELVRGLTSAMPSDWSHAVADALLAIRMSLRGLQESEIRAAVGTSASVPGLHEVETSLPMHLWSAIRINLGSAFSVRGPFIDVSGGPILEWSDQRLVSDAARVQSVADGLSAALQKAPPLRRWTEAPQLAQICGGPLGLETFVSEPANIHELVNVGETFAEGWLTRLGAPSVRRVVAEWEVRLAVPGERKIAWQLGLMAARIGETHAGLRLMELAPQLVNDPSGTKERQSLIAFLKQDGGYLTQLARVIVNAPQSASETAVGDIVSGLSIVGAYADGVVELEPALERPLITRLTKAIRARGDPLLELQLQVFSGQLLLMRAKWFWATRMFANAEATARKLGHARLLCQALERLAAVQIERNKFRAAQRAAAECRDLAFRAGLARLEALAFERQIEVERRRANWTAAYELVNAFRSRCHEGLCDVSRADLALATLEARN
jgi:hypothetical protein